MSGRLAATVAYDGTGFQGWQVQPGARTVQEEIERAFERLCGGKRPRIHGSGRTDTGVHARGQVFHVDPERKTPYPPQKWLEALNGVLPPDIRIMDVRTVPAEFHARFDAVEKEYRYRIDTRPVVPPDLRFTRCPCRRTLDVEAMRAGAELLRGEHDFLSFSASRGAPERTTVRDLRRLEVVEEDEGLTLVAVADGFLYKMVRQLAGALLRVGSGELSLAELGDLVEVPERTHLAPTAPPQGLFLWNVRYPDF